MPPLAVASAAVGEHALHKARPAQGGKAVALWFSKQQQTVQGLVTSAAARQQTKAERAPAPSKPVETSWYFSRVAKETATPKVAGDSRVGGFRI